MIWSRTESSASLAMKVGQPCHNAKHAFMKTDLSLRINCQIDCHKALFRTVDVWLLHNNANPHNGWLQKDGNATQCGLRPLICIANCSTTYAAF